MSTVKVGTSGLSSTELVPYGQGIHDAIVGNPNYTTPTPTMAVVQGAIDTLAAANAAVDNNDGRQEHTARRAADLELRLLLKQLASYVQLTSNGDEGKILSSGFAVVKRGTPYGELNRPTSLSLRPSNTTGRVAMGWKRERGAELFHVYRSLSSEPFKWELVGVTTKSRFNSDGNTPGTFYWFSVTAIGAAGESSKSEELHAMAAA
ncbi:MAG: hypothetical protein WAU70_01855 [Flavobacteriales bacterium]